MEPKIVSYFCGMKEIRRHALFSLLALALLCQGCTSPRHSSLPRAASPVDTTEFGKVFTDVAAVGDTLHSLMVLSHGKVIYERYAPGHDADEKHIMHSVSKSFLSMAVGFAVEEGLLDVNAKAWTFFTDGELPPHAERSERLLSLTVRDLLTMSSGLANGDVRRDSDNDWARDTWAIPFVFDPGTQFSYNSMNSYLLSVIVSRVTGMKVDDYLEPRLFAPLGITSHRWVESPQGYNAGGWGLYLTTESLARMTQFVLQRGRWHGRQLLDEAWFDVACTPQIMQYAGTGITDEEARLRYAGDQWNSGYGYQFWIGTDGCVRLHGAYGQYGIAMPDKDLVVVTTAYAPQNKVLYYSIWEHIHNRF